MRSSYKRDSVIKDSAVYYIQLDNVKTGTLKIVRFVRKYTGYLHRVNRGICNT